jgi:hypothetical protein
MIINVCWLECSYCMIKFILKYKLSLMSTILLLARPVQLTLPNCNSTLQNQMHFLGQTYGNCPVEPYQQFYPRCHPFHYKLVSTGHMTSGILPYLTDPDHYSESSASCSASRDATFSFFLPRFQWHAGNAVSFGRLIR